MLTVTQEPIALSTRPPTPPKEHIEETANLSIDSTIFLGTLGQQILLDTPNESPSSSSECVGSSAGKPSKRVVFSPWTKYHKALSPKSKTPVTDITLRCLPPSKQCTTMRKSILKPSAENHSPTIGLPQQWTLDPKDDIPAMLRSVTQHLTRASRISRLDTYRTLLGCLGAYEEVLDTQMVADSLAAFLEFIRRDICAKLRETDAPDIELITAALKVLSTILYIQDLVDATSDQFCTFVAEQAISAMGSSQLPKIVIDHHMHLLARQKLPSKIINAERATRMLNALNGLEHRLKGNRVIGLKLMIYQRLLAQARSSMVPRAEEWLEFLLSSMASSIKDIRSRAIAFGIDAALALGTTSTVSQACLDLLHGETPSGSKVIDFLGDRLLEILVVKDEGVHVPQIWSVIILFLRSRRRQLERWEHLKGWLSIMERSFNSSDPKIKLQANLAWSRLVAALNLDVSTSPSLLKVLRQPIASQLERKGSDKHLRHAKQLARSTYCTVLYYAFRPGASPEQLDLYWDSFVSPVLTIKPSATASDHDFACEVLGAILSASQPRLWNQDRAYQLSSIKAHELPCLDPKWVRMRISKVADLVENLLSHTNFARVEDAQQLPFHKTWQSFAKALGDASSKEVKVSIETLTTIAHVISMLNKHTLRRLEQYMILLNEIVTKVGFRPFTEKRLLRASSGRTFEVAETPSSRSSHPRGSLNSPVMYVMDALVNDRQASASQATYRDAIQSMLTIALRTANSRRTQLAVLQEMVTDVLSTSSSESDNRLHFWQGVATQTQRALCLPQSKLQDSDSPLRPDQDYKEVVKVLELGIREFHVDLFPGWKDLSDAVISRIREETSESCVALAYTEPLCRAICSHDEKGSAQYSNTALRCASHLLNCARWPRSREDLERARKLLWGIGPINQRPVSFDPFDHLYTLVGKVLASTYSNFQPGSLGATAELLSSVGSFLASCPQPLKAICLKKIQAVIAVWIEDAKAVISEPNHVQAAGFLYSAVKELWKASLAALHSISKPGDLFLLSVEDLVVAGFRSRHKAIVNDMITTWNKTFAQADILEYPPALRTVLTKLRPMVDLELPGFIDDEETEVMSSPFSFVESQDEEPNVGSLVAPRGTRSMVHGPLLHPTSKETGQPRAVPTHSPLARSSPREPKVTPRGRLRHDNSQIQFAAIDSSPLAPEPVESQHLTIHQKEVKERQEQDAAMMFPDIRSSPRRSRSVECPPELILHRKQARGETLDADADPSPTFPPGDTVMSDFLGSSPTPRSNLKASLERRATDGPASSPPASPSPIFHRSASTSSPQNTESPKLPQTIFIKRTTDSEVTNAILAADPGNEKEVARDMHNVSAYGQPALDQTSDASVHGTTDAEIESLSDTDEYVDASQDPVADIDTAQEKSNNWKTSALHEVNDGVNGVLQQPVTPQKISDGRTECAHEAHTGNDEISLVEDSFFQEAPSTPTEDEQAREQLLRDLEEASSQGDSQVAKRRPSISSPSEKISRKRKLQSSDDAKTCKKTKVAPASQSFEVVVETRKPDERDKEVIVIDDRVRSVSPAIKREISPSPIRTIHTPIMRTTGPNMSHSRRRTRSMTRSSSSHGPELEDTATSAPQHKMAANANHGDSDFQEEHPRKKQRTSGRDERTEQQSTSVDGQVDMPAIVPSAEIEADTTDEMATITSSQLECIKDLILSNGDPPVRDHVQSSASDNDNDTVPNTPHDGAPDPTPAATSNQSTQQQQTTPPRSPGQRLLARFRGLLNDLKQATLWPQEEREIREVAFEAVREVHEAGYRNGTRHGSR
ncbi:MAG: hypothetical protein Q9218_000013 [Villophora microphyllina]